MELLLVAISALVLAFGLAAALVSVCNSQTRQFRGLLETVRDQQKEMLAMTEARFVAEHLRQRGVGPYLAGVASERVAKDIEEVAKILGCDEKQAIQYILRGTVVGPEPTRDAVNG